MTTRTVMATPSSVLSLRGLALDVDHAAECDDPRSPGLSEEWHDILEVHTPNSARRGAKWDPASSPAGIRDGYSRASCPRDAPTCPTGGPKFRKRETPFPFPPAGCR